MYSQFKDQVFQKDCTSYLVLKQDSDASDWFWVKAINAERAVVRVHRDEIARGLRNPVGLQASTR